MTYSVPFAGLRGGQMVPTTHVHHPASFSEAIMYRNHQPPRPIPPGPPSNLFNNELPFNHSASTLVASTYRPISSPSIGQRPSTKTQSSQMISSRHYGASLANIGSSPLRSEIVRTHTPVHSMSNSHPKSPPPVVRTLPRSYHEIHSRLPDRSIPDVNSSMNKPAAFLSMSGGYHHPPGRMYQVAPPVTRPTISTVPSHLRSQGSSTATLDSPVDYVIDDIPLPCAYLQLPWKADRAWARLKAAVNASLSPTPREIYVMSHIRDVVSRMMVERMTVHPSVYIIRYTHFQDGLIATLLPELLLSSIDRGIPPMRDPQVAEKLFELSRVVYSGTHTLGVGFTSPMDKPDISHFVSNGGHCVTQIYLKSTVQTLPNSWNQLIKLWTPIRRRLIEDQYRISYDNRSVTASRRSDGSYSKDDENHYGNNFTNNPLVKRAAVDTRSEGRLGHLVVLYDLRFDNEANSKPWCPDYMRRWVWLSGLTHAVINSWLAVETEGRSIQILLLPPISFHRMIDEGIVKLSTTRRARQTLPANNWVDPFIRSREEAAKKKANSPTQLRKSKKGILSFCMSSPERDSNESNRVVLYEEDITPPPSRRRSDDDLELQAGLVAEFPYAGLDDEVIRNKNEQIKGLPEKPMGGGTVGVKRFFGGKPSRPMDGSIMQQPWKDDEEFAVHLVNKGIQSPKHGHTVKDDYSVSHEDVKPTKGDEPKHSAICPSTMITTSQPEAVCDFMESDNHWMETPIGGNMTPPHANMTRADHRIRSTSQNRRSPQCNTNASPTSNGFYSPLSRLVESPLNLRVSDTYRQSGLRDTTDIPTPDSHPLTPNNLKMHNFSQERMTSESPESPMAGIASRQRELTEQTNEVSEVPLTRDEEIILNQAKRILEKKRPNAASTGGPAMSQHSSSWRGMSEVASDRLASIMEQGFNGQKAILLQLTNLMQQQQQYQLSSQDRSMRNVDNSHHARRGRK